LEIDPNHTNPGRKEAGHNPNPGAKKPLGGLKGRDPKKSSKGGRGEVPGKDPQNKRG